MKLAGQGANCPDARRSEFDERGYIMVALLVGMAVVAVWMTALLPSWRQQIIREREAELVFRGEQYARAIVLYRTKNNNQLPPNMDVLVSGHYLRKKYLDPITGKEFIPVGGMTTNPLAGNPTAGGGNPTTGGGNNPGRGGVGTQGQPPQGPGTTQGQVGISGVRSTSTDSSIRIYKNQQTYSQWPFDWNQMALQMGRQNPTGQPGGGRPGGPGGNNGPRGTGPGTNPTGGPGTGNGPGVGGPGGIRGGGGPGGGPIRNPTGGGGPLGAPGGVGGGRAGGSTPN